MIFFEPIKQNLFFTKNDPHDTRLGDLFKNLDNSTSSASSQFAVIGYPDDEGIQLNGGRIGAAQAPDKIREYLYKMTPPCAIDQLTKFRMADGGNLRVTELSLADRHDRAAESLIALYQSGFKPISLGGGHDYGFSDSSAFLNHHLQKNPGVKPFVLNFDAHMDVRPTDKGLNSGTPFYRLLTAYEGKCEFIEIGIQPQCNSTAHKQWAKSKGAHIFDLQWLQKNGGLSSLMSQSPFVQPLNSTAPKTPLFISFDIDALSSSEAGGCSQSWATGLKTEECLQFFSQLSQQFDLSGLGIYEVSPPLDTDNRTSKTAALLAYYFIFQGLL